ASPRSTNGAAIGRYSRIMAEAERLRQSLLADAGRGDLLRTIIAYRLEQTGRAPSERSADDPVARPAHAGRSAPEPTARLRLHPRGSAANQFVSILFSRLSRA